MAAVLACGHRAVLSHHTAAALWELVVVPPTGAPIHVSGPRSLRGPRSGVRLHRLSRLDTTECDRKHGLPLTNPARTLLDLASCAGPYELERAFARAERRKLVTDNAIRALLERHLGRPGSPRLRDLLGAATAPALTRSEAEARFLGIVRKAALPNPRSNVVVDGLEVDFLWRDQHLVVEIDGFQFHADRAAFERDRHRDSVLTAAGLRVMRFTWRQLTDEPEATLARLAQALAVGRG